MAKLSVTTWKGAVDGNRTSISNILEAFELNSATQKAFKNLIKDNLEPSLENPVVLFLLGQMTGFHTPTGQEFLEKSANLNFGPAIATQAKWLMEGGSACMNNVFMREDMRGPFFKLHLKAATAGWRKSMLIVADCYKQGFGTNMHIMKHDHWIRQSNRIE